MRVKEKHRIEKCTYCTYTISKLSQTQNCQVTITGSRNRTFQFARAPSRSPTVTIAPGAEILCVRPPNPDSSSGVFQPHSPPQALLILMQRSNSSCFVKHNISNPSPCPGPSPCHSNGFPGFKLTKHGFLCQPLKQKLFPCSVNECNPKANT